MAAFSSASGSPVLVLARLDAFAFPPEAAFDGSAFSLPDFVALALV